MKLYLITQNVADGYDTYDTYDSAVVAAESEDAARKTHPSSIMGLKWDDKTEQFVSHDKDGQMVIRKHPWNGDWAQNIKDVRVELIGDAREGTEAGVICASFNAG